MRIVGGRQRAMHGVQHALILLRAGDREHAGIGLLDLLGFRTHATGDDHLAVLGHGLADRRERFLLGAVEEAAGIDDDDVGPVMLAGKLVALGAQARDDALGIHQSLGAPERHEADLRRSRLIHIQICLIDRVELVPIAHNYNPLHGSRACYGGITGGEGAISAKQSPKIVIVDESPIRAAILEEGLREAGFTQIVHIREMQSLLARIYAVDPDIILIDLENPSRDVLEAMFQVSRAVKRPIAMFVDQSDSSSIQASVEAGVSAYIVDGLRKERIKPILDLCVSRFNAFAKLQEELERTKSQLEDRKVIEKAKGILMKVKGLTEHQALCLVCSTAMREKKKIGEIAQSIITASEMLK